jgi:hypothetical protein
VALRLDVAIGVGGLADAGMPELALHPPDVRATLEQPSRKGVAGGVIRPVGELGAFEQRNPNLLDEERIADQVAARGREDHLALLGRPLVEGAVEVDRLEVTAQRFQQRRARLHPLSLPFFGGATAPLPLL